MEESLLMMLISLLKIDARNYYQMEMIEKAGVEIRGFWSDEVFDIVLTALGVPPTTTQCGVDSPAWFCRDWYTDKWYGILSENDITSINFQQYIKWVQKEVKDYHMGIMKEKP